ncbi:hypothetical protein F4554_005078 [Actinopolymorpha rutila]|uniref:Uncharacterized protein n=1 Tax=Actinopolymorpha rutila TaxID=446787 RepID=A0A852ZTW6_9ACTN|nr:hypothetical protein [Actinopolymorpha rutila]
MGPEPGPPDAEESLADILASHWEPVLPPEPADTIVIASHGPNWITVLSAGDPPNLKRRT